MNLLQQFLTDDRTLLLAILIGLDLATGIIAALRTGQFDLRRVADFYRSLVLPGLLGYLTIWLLGLFSAARFPELSGVILLLTQWFGAGVLAAALVTSITRNVTAPIPPPQP